MYHFIEVKLLKNNSSNNKQKPTTSSGGNVFLLILNVIIRVFQSLVVFGVILIVLGGSLGLG
ncbi:hypothetical protein IV479_16415, partial [Enterococcus faecalis]|nr:hypothetical protein [Enterococcus faecalis]